MSTTKIEWADKVWNPITGCSHSGSPGCDHCYARRMAYRLKGRYGYPQDDPFRVTFHSDRLDEPLHWKKSSRIFVVSMGDLFHEEVKYSWIESIMETVIMQPQHIFLFLTKRPQGMKEMLEGWKLWAKENLWLGVSVENQPTADERIPILWQIPAAKRFISCEPLLEEIRLRRGIYQMGTPNGIREYGTSVEGIDLCIVGGETGPKARPMNPDWARSLRDQCQASGVPFFFKSWGSQPYPSNTEISKWVSAGYDPYSKPRENYFLDGQKWREFPK